MTHTGDKTSRLVTSPHSLRPHGVQRLTRDLLLHNWMMSKLYSATAGVFFETVIVSAAHADGPDISAQRLLESWKGEDLGMRMVAEVIASALTDNGTHFTTLGNTSSAAPDIKAALDAGEPVWAHAFEYACVSPAENSS